MIAKDPMVAELIREVLAEELARLRTGVREERVRIASDGDLAAFAGRILAIADDRKERAAFEKGDLVFRLDAAGDSRRPASGSGVVGAGGGRLHGGAAPVTARPRPRAPRPRRDPEAERR